MDNYQKRRVCVLVKAYPQPSQKYEETVCVAAVTEDHQLVRLYPIRFRHLPEEKRFNRFDWIEVEMTRALDDPRPESFKVKEDTIQIVRRSDKQSLEDRVRLWKASVVESLDLLKTQQHDTKRSLGIVRPDPESVRFTYEPLGRATKEAQETTKSVYFQQSLLEKPLTQLLEPEYVFRYKFTSGGNKHEMQLHDWEVEATYHNYKTRYGSVQAALDKMVEYFQALAPTRNLHLIMGNMHKRPWQFIIIGVLRTTADFDQADAQSALF